MSRVQKKPDDLTLTQCVMGFASSYKSQVLGGVWSLGTWEHKGHAQGTLQKEVQCMTPKGDL